MALRDILSGAGQGFLASGFNPLGALIGGGLGLFGASQAAGTMGSAAQRAAAGSQFSPYGVTSGLGQGMFQGGQGSFQLDPRFQGLSNQLTDLSGGFLSQAGQFDPNQAAQSQFQQMESILQPGRERQRKSIEGGLLSQGRLGSTGGALTQQGYEAAVEQERARNLWGAMGQAQQIQGNLLNRGIGTMQGAAGLQQQGIQNLQLGGQLGSQAAGAVAQAGMFGMRGAESQAALQSGMWSGLGSAAQQYLPGMMSGMFGGGNPQIDPSTGGLTSEYRQQQGFLDIPGVQ